MVRMYKRKTNRSQTINADVMMVAVEKVRNGQSIRTVAAGFGVNFKTLANYCKTYNTSGKGETPAPPPPPSPTPRPEEPLMPEPEPAEVLEGDCNFFICKNCESELDSEKDSPNF